MHYRNQRNYGCRIHDQYTYKGMRVLILENDLVRISILLDKGADIYEYLYKPKDLDFVWLSVNGVQNPNHYLTSTPDLDAAFLDYYPGGWQEVIPNGGPRSDYLGATFGQHGEAAQMPWDYVIVEDTECQATVRLSVRLKKLPLKLTKNLRLTKGDGTLYIDETLNNLSPVPLRYMWGHHLAFGPPFLTPGTRIVLPEGITVLTESVDSPVAKPERVKRGIQYQWPLAASVRGHKLDLSLVPEPDGTSDIYYLTDFGNKAGYRLENSALNMGISVEWDGKAFPYLWYWQEFGGTQSYPWFGRNYNIGLEPFSSFPTHGIAEAIRNESAAAIGPWERRESCLRIRPYEL